MERVAQMMQRLNPAQQEVISLRFSGELSAEEAGAVMGRTPGAIRELQRTALKALRALMGPEAAVHPGAASGEATGPQGGGGRWGDHVAVPRARAARRAPVRGGRARGGGCAGGAVGGSGLEDGRGGGGPGQRARRAALSGDAGGRARPARLRRHRRALIDAAHAADGASDEGARCRDQQRARAVRARPGAADRAPQRPRAEVGGRPRALGRRPASGSRRLAG